MSSVGALLLGSLSSITQSSMLYCHTAGNADRYFTPVDSFWGIQQHATNLEFCSETVPVRLVEVAGQFRGTAVVCAAWELDL